MDMDGWVVLQEDVKSFMRGTTWSYSGDFFDVSQEVIEEIRDKIYEEVRQKRAIRKAKELERIETKRKREQTKIQLERESNQRRIQRRIPKRIQVEPERFFEVDSPIIDGARRNGTLSGYPMGFEDIRPCIIARDEGRCPICNQPIENPVVHHIDQNRFNNNPYNLITVCGMSCHHSRGMHDTPNRGKDPHLMVYLQVLAQRRQDYRGVA